MVLRSVNPDVVIFQEARDPSVVKWLAERLNASLWASHKRISLAFLSRVPLLHWRWHRTKPLKHPVLEVRLKHLPVNVFGIHLRPHFSKWAERGRVQEVKSVLDGILDSRLRRTPHLLTGDFNAVAPNEEALVARMPLWIKALIRLSGGRVGSEAIATLLQAGYIDGFRRINPQGQGYTFPSFGPHVRFDYAFLSPDLVPRLSDCSIVSAEATTKASDHLPLLTILDNEGGYHETER
jgi:exodeoxyribonuclease-3